MVTRPGLFGCLYCRWLPRVLTNTQPCPSSRRITSRILGISYYSPLRRQFYPGDAVAALTGRGGRVRAHEGVLRQHLADGAAQGTRPLPVDDAHLAQADAERLVQPLLHEEERLVRRHAAPAELA